MPDETRFQFGKNWQKFLNCLTPARFETAQKSITDFMERDNLKGKTFIDIGCGSGLFSRAAHQLGADRLVSFDYDEFSVACAKHLHEQLDSPDNWQITQGSVLDKPFLETLGKFDIVYSWGVLHHTGEMWNAIRNAGEMVAPNGQFYIAIYNRKRGYRGSNYWAWRKRLYCKAPTFIKKLVNGCHVLYHFQSKLWRFKNPMKGIRQYQSKRGMDWYTDLIDWIGGYPYEAANVQEIFAFMKKNFPDFQLTNLAATDDLGCSSFLFERRTGDQPPRVTT